MDHDVEEGGGILLRKPDENVMLEGGNNAFNDCNDTFDPVVVLDEPDGKDDDIGGDGGEDDDEADEILEGEGEALNRYQMGREEMLARFRHRPPPAHSGRNPQAVPQRGVSAGTERSIERGFSARTESAASTRSISSTVALSDVSAGSDLEFIHTHTASSVDGDSSSSRQRARPQSAHGGRDQQRNSPSSYDGRTAISPVHEGRRSGVGQRVAIPSHSTTGLQSREGHTCLESDENSAILDNGVHVNRQDRSSGALERNVVDCARALDTMNSNREVYSNGDPLSPASRRLYRPKPKTVAKDGHKQSGKPTRKKPLSAGGNRSNRGDNREGRENTVVLGGVPLPLVDPQAFTEFWKDRQETLSSTGEDSQGRSQPAFEVTEVRRLSTSGIASTVDGNRIASMRRRPWSAHSPSWQGTSSTKRSHPNGSVSSSSYSGDTSNGRSTARHSGPSDQRSLAQKSTAVTGGSGANLRALRSQQGRRKKRPSSAKILEGGVSHVTHTTRRMRPMSAQARVASSHRSERRDQRNGYKHRKGDGRTRRRPKSSGGIPNHLQNATHATGARGLHRAAMRASGVRDAISLRTSPTRGKRTQDALRRSVVVRGGEGSDGVARKRHTEERQEDGRVHCGHKCEG